MQVHPASGCVCVTIYSFSYPLIGTCSPPKPQGPFLIRSGTYRKINFKNPFNETKTFKITVRPECFHVTANSIEVEGKKQTRVSVGILPAIAESTAMESTYPRTGKMIIKCEDASGTNIKWPFYLEEECATGVDASHRSSKSSLLSSSTSKTSKSGHKSTKSIRSNNSTKSTRSVRTNVS